MAADQEPKQAGKAQAALTKTVRAVTRPGGKDVDWEKVRTVGAIIGAVTLLHGLKTRTWRYTHTAAAALAIWRGRGGTSEGQICRAIRSA